jgi:hypothetical protein
MGFGARDALILLGSLISVILVVAAHTFFQVAAPRVYGLTFGAAGLGVGIWIFYLGVRDDDGWAVLGGFVLGGVYLVVAIVSLADREDGNPLPGVAVAGVTVGGIAGGVGGAYLLDWIQDSLGWNVVGVIMGTALGAMAGAVVTAAGHETYALERVIAVAGTFFLAYFVAVAVDELVGPEEPLLPLPSAVEGFADDLFGTNNSSPKLDSDGNVPEIPSANADATHEGPETVGCKFRPRNVDYVCKKIIITSTGSESLLLIGPDPWNAFAPDESGKPDSGIEGCLMGRPYPHGEKCYLIVRIAKDKLQTIKSVNIHDNRRLSEGFVVQFP